MKDFEKRHVAAAADREDSAPLEHQEFHCQLKLQLREVWEEEFSDNGWDIEAP